MSQKSSTFITETREREAWVPGAVEREGANGRESEQLLAVAALVRGTVDALPVPEDAEERSRAAAIAALQEMSLSRSQPTNVTAPWYLRLGHFMRYVFTLGRRR
jgi:hypothetical protein